MSSESGSSRANSDTPDKAKKEKPTPKLSKVEILLKSNMSALKVLSSEMDPAEIRHIR